jgi:hypothetical protein
VKAIEPPVKLSAFSFQQSALEEFLAGVVSFIQATFNQGIFLPPPFLKGGD